MRLGDEDRSLGTHALFGTQNPHNTNAHTNTHRVDILPLNLPNNTNTNLFIQGMMKGQELSEAYASADVFVMPSETETLGFVVLEAMASGVPVVAVAAGGLTDIITAPGRTGLMYAPGDYAAAAAHVRRLAEDPAARAEIGAAGRAEVEAFGWTAATRKIRTQQYARAIRLARGKKRFRWLALRVGLVRLWRALGGSVVAALAAVVATLDYARAYRAPAQQQQEPPSATSSA